MSGDSPYCFDIKTTKVGEDPTIIGQIQFVNPVEIVPARRGRPNLKDQFQITRGLVGENSDQPWKRFKKGYTRCIHLAQEVTTEDIIIREPESKYKVLDEVTDVIKDHGIRKEVFEITTEQFGEFIYQGPFNLFRLMLVVKAEDCQSYVVITTFTNNNYRPHPSWKLYQFSRELLNQIHYTTNKHEYGKTLFHITNIEVPSLQKIGFSISEAIGPEYIYKDIILRVGELDSEDEKEFQDSDEG
jgi:hypothetical protein